MQYLCCKIPLLVELLIVVTFATLVQHTEASISGHCYGPSSHNKYQIDGQNIGRNHKLAFIWQLTNRSRRRAHLSWIRVQLWSYEAWWLLAWLGLMIRAFDDNREKKAGERKKKTLRQRSSVSTVPLWAQKTVVQKRLSFQHSFW